MQVAVSCDLEVPPRGSSNVNSMAANPSIEYLIALYLSVLVLGVSCAGGTSCQRSLNTVSTDDEYLMNRGTCGEYRITSNDEDPRPEIAVTKTRVPNRHTSPTSTYGSSPTVALKRTFRAL